MATRKRGKSENRLRAKRFEAEIVKTSDLLLEAIQATEEQKKNGYQAIKQQIGRMVKRLLDSKLLREQDFYVGDWVMPVLDRHSEPCEVIDINYALRTARIKDPVEGEIWVRFQDIVKDEDSLRLV